MATVNKSSKRRLRKSKAEQRLVMTLFFGDYNGLQLIKVNRSKWAEKACVRCVDLLRADHYPEALSAEVYGADGTLYAAVRRDRTGKKVTVLFEHVFIV